MDTPIPHAPTDEANRDEARAVRKRWEREKIERGRRQMETGHFIEGDELDRWLDLYDASDDPAPISLHPVDTKAG